MRGHGGAGFVAFGCELGNAALKLAALLVLAVGDGHVPSARVFAVQAFDKHAVRFAKLIGFVHSAARRAE